MDLFRGRDHCLVPGREKKLYRPFLLTEKGIRKGTLFLLVVCICNEGVTYAYPWVRVEGPLSPPNSYTRGIREQQGEENKGRGEEAGERAEPRTIAIMGDHR